MKNFFLLVVMVVMFFFIEKSQAECDFSTVEKVGDKFQYNRDCHLKVGTLVKNEGIQEERIGKLEKSLELKDLALDKADERISNFRNESINQNQKVIDISNKSKYSDNIAFAAGVAVAILSGYVYNLSTK